MTHAKGNITFGIYGEGRKSLEWARNLESLGPDFWYYSPLGQDLVSVLDIAPRADVKSSPPFFSDGYTDIIVFAGKPSSERTELIEEALNKRIAVLCEPPLARTSEEASKLNKLAKEKEVCLITAFRPIHSNAYNQCAYWANNMIGDVHSIFVDWAEVDYDVDPLWDILPDAIASVGAMFEDPIVEFNAQHGPRWIVSSMGDSKGREFVFTVKGGVARPEHRITVLGTYGSIECLPYQEEVILRRKAGEYKKDHGRGAGPIRSLLLLMAQRVIDFKRFGKEQIYGEIGLGVTDILCGVDEFLADK